MNCSLVLCFILCKNKICWKEQKQIDMKYQMEKRVYWHEYQNQTVSTIATAGISMNEWEWQCQWMRKLDFHEEKNYFCCQRQFPNKSTQPDNGSRSNSMLKCYYISTVFLWFFLRHGHRCVNHLQSCSSFKYTTRKSCVCSKLLSMQ